MGQNLGKSYISNLDSTRYNKLRLTEPIWAEPRGGCRTGLSIVEGREKGWDEKLYLMIFIFLKNNNTNNNYNIK